MPKQTDLATSRRLLARRIEERAWFVEGLLSTDTEYGREQARRIVNRELERLAWATAADERRQFPPESRPQRSGSIDRSILGCLSVAGACGLLTMIGWIWVEAIRELLGAIR